MLADLDFAFEDRGVVQAGGPELPNGLLGFLFRIRPSPTSLKKEGHMRKGILSAIVSLAVVLILGSVQPAVAQFYTQRNLVSDGAVPADLLDTDMVNAWGLVSGPTTPWWIADNGTGRTTLYNVGTGAIQATFTVPGAGGQQGTPTGVVFNGGTGFVVNNGLGSSPARFIFASEDGTISAFRGAPIVIVVPKSGSGAVSKGIAIDSTTAGTLLYATNFHAGTVDVFDSTFTPLQMPGAFVDPDLPPGYAPFGIQNLDGTIYVT